MSEIDTGYQLRPLSIEIERFLEEMVPAEDRNPLDELLVRELLNVAKEQEEDGERIRATIEQWTGDINKWHQLLPQLGREVDTWFLRRDRHERYSDAWWDKKKGELHATFQEDQDQGLKNWLQAFAEALIDWELDICQKLVDEQFHFAVLSMFVPLLFRSGLASLREGNYQAAMGMLTYLAQPGQRDSMANTLPPINRAVLLVFIGRIYMDAEEFEAALPMLELARDVAPQDGRPLAALGHYYQLQQDYDRAISNHEKAISLSPDQPDGSVGMGLVLEDQEWWEEAEDLYDQAVASALKHKDPYSALSKLLAPPSGKLFLQLARALETEAPEAALQAVTRSLELEIKGEGSYPECAGYELQGEILEVLLRDEAAALAFYEAGRRHGWRNDYEPSIKLLKRSLELDKEYQPTYWILSDNLRMSTNDIESEDERKETIEESLEIWKQGERLPGFPPPDESWTYLNLAFLFELKSGFSDVSPEQISGYLWQALIAVERACLLKVDESLRWAYLGHYYRILKLEWNALAATEQAFELDADNTMAREERLIILTNRGLFVEALEVADSWLELDDTYEPWVRYIKAYILSRQRDCEPALELSDDHEAQHYWVNGLRIHCHIMLGQTDGVLKECQAILDDHKARDTTEWAAVGWAALTIALLDEEREDLLEEAIVYLKKALNNPYEALEASIGLGVCYLSKQETFVEGKEFLQDAILLTTNVREVDDLETIDFRRILLLARNWEHRQEVEQFLDQLAEEHIKPRREELFEEDMSPEEELEERATFLLEQGETDAFAWWGVQAGLARIYMEQEQWQEAAETYRQLYTKTNIIPEAVIGLEKAAEELHQQAVVYVESGKYEAAVPMLELSLELAEMLDQRDKIPQMHGQCAYAEFMLSHLENAHYHFTEALQLYHLLGDEDPGQAIGQLALSLIPDAKSYWMLDARLQTFAGDVDNEALKTEITDARLYLKGYLDNLYRLPEQESFAPVVPRLALELSPALISEDKSSVWQLLNDSIPAFREQIQKAYGLEIPGVRVRAGAGYLEEGEYFILLDETLIAVGRTVLGDTTDIVEHLQLIVRRNLHNFLGVEEVERLLRSWQADERGTLLVNTAMPDQASRLHFARLLQALLREQVPITSPEAILELFQDVDLAGIEVAEALEEVRLHLKHELPGNDGRSEQVWLPDEIESEFTAHVRQDQDNGNRFLAMPAETAGKLLEAISQLVPTGRQETVLVCRDGGLRPLIRRFIEHRFPDLLVLSHAESELQT